MGVRNFGAEFRRIEDPKLLTGQGRTSASSAAE